MRNTSAFEYVQACKNTLRNYTKQPLL